MKAKFTDAQYIEDCIKAMQNICTTYCTGIPTTIKEVLKIINTLSPLHITTAKLLIEHNMIHENGTHIVVRNNKITKKRIPTYKFRPVLERPHARAFVMAVLQEKHKTSIKNYEKIKSKSLIKEEKEVEKEVDVEELNTTLDKLLGGYQEPKESEIPLKDFIKKPASFNFFNHSDITLEEAIKVVKAHGGIITF